MQFSLRFYQNDLTNKNLRVGNNGRQYERFLDESAVY